MTDDLVERLRDPYYAGIDQHLRSSDEIDRLFNAAADRIEAMRDQYYTALEQLANTEADNAALRAQLDEARMALDEIAAVEPRSNCDAGSMARSRMRDIARAYARRDSR